MRLLAYCVMPNHWHLVLHPRLPPGLPTLPPPSHSKNAGPTRQLAEFLAGLRADTLPAETIEAAKVFVLDLIGCTLGAMRTEEVRIAAEVVRLLGGTPESTAIVKAFVAERFPTLSDAPIVGSEVCQYENSSNGDFLIDRHPQHSNVWLVGGGSGHGFKHGPALGAYVADRITKGGETDAKFSLATKDKVQSRAVH